MAYKRLQWLVGKEITLDVDGSKVKITEVYDYEPPDPSVGIWSGYVTVRAGDEDYDIDDNGRVSIAGDNKDCGNLGQELWPDLD
jgi:hypothetical protein